MQRLFGRKPREGNLSRSSRERELLEAVARTRPSVSPDTAAQWLRLRRALTHETVRSASRLHPRPIRRVSFGLGIVAVCLIVGYLYFRTSILHEELVYATGRGERTQVVLPDSSEIELNHTSQLVLDMESGVRRVDLVGEAFFRVHNNGRPFIVTTELATVTVVGTEFNVHMRRGVMEVGVVKGIVRVSASRDGVDSTVTLRRGQVTTCLTSGLPVAPRPIPGNNYPSWLHGEFRFNNTTLAEACEDLGARFDIEIALSDPQLASETITGVIDGRSADGAISSLATLIGKQYRYANRVYTLY